MQLSVMVTHRFCVVASITRYSQWIFANAACIVGVAFRDTILFAQVLGYVTLTFSPQLKQGDSCINHHCAATEAVASYTMSDRRYFPCAPRYGMY